MSKRYPFGHDPYNSADARQYLLEVIEPTEAERIARCAPRVTLILPAGLVALEPVDAEPFEFPPPALGAGPLNPE